MQVDLPEVDGLQQFLALFEDLLLFLSLLPLLPEIPPDQPGRHLLLPRPNLPYLPLGLRQCFLPFLLLFLQALNPFLDFFPLLLDEGIFSGLDLLLEEQQFALAALDGFLEALREGADARVVGVWYLLLLLHNNNNARLNQSPTQQT